MVNKVLLIGNLGKDPEFKHLPSGSSVANFSLATTEKFTKDGNKQEQTEWHNITAYGKQADLCSQYLKKGSKVYLEGKLHYSTWDDKDGQKRYKTEIILNHITFLSANQSNGSSSQPISATQNEPLPF